MSKSVSGGRPKSSGVWDYFKYDVNKNQTQCMIVVSTKSNNVCGKVITGRNPTNLKSHMQAFHKSTVYRIQGERDSVKEQSSRSSTCRKICITCDDAADHSLHESERTRHFTVHSDQYKTRVRALARMVVETGMPSTYASSESFRVFCQVLDRKFIVPG